MTVGELIEELQKQPAHHTAFVRTDEGDVSIVDVQADGGGTVAIDCTDDYPET